MNTAIAALMALINDISAKGSITRGEFKTLITLLNPFAPHLTEELWVSTGFEGMLNAAKWPEFDEAKCEDATVEIVVQVNGKIKCKLNIAVDISSADAIALAKEQEQVVAALDGKTVVKELYVPKKLVNIVVK